MTGVHLCLQVYTGVDANRCVEEVDVLETDVEKTRNERTNGKENQDTNGGNATNTNGRKYYGGSTSRSCSRSEWTRITPIDKSACLERPSPPP